MSSSGWLRRFVADGRPGPYLRVLEPGPVEAGDAVVVEHRPGHGITVSDVFRGLHGDAGPLARLDDVPEVPEKARAAARRAAARRR